MKQILSTCMMVLLSLPAMAQTKSVYTDVNKCGGEDTKNDMFFHECKGPDGRHITLSYVEGIARIVIDDDLESPAADVKIPVGGRGKVFGEKIEWRMRNGKSCAAIVRVSTNVGSRLIVTSLGKPAQIFAWDPTNKEAQKTSELACDSVDKPYTPPGELAIEIRGSWTLSGRCGDASKVTIGPKSVTMTSPAGSVGYDKVDEAFGYLHGGNYNGDEYALLAFPKGGNSFETVLAVNADEQKDRIKIVDTSDALKAKFAEIVDKPLKLCR